MQPTPHFARAAAALAALLALAAPPPASAEAKVVSGVAHTGGWGLAGTLNRYTYCAFNSAADCTVTNGEFAPPGLPAVASGSVGLGLITASFSGGGGHLDNPWIYTVGSQSAMRMLWTDEAQVLSDTLAPGTQVTLRYTIKVDTQVSTWGDVYSDSDLVVSGSPYLDCCYAGVERWMVGHGGIPGQAEVTGEVTARVGSPILLGGHLSYNFMISPTNTDSGYDGQVQARYFVDALDPSVRLVTASGHDYGTLAAVPEPGTWAMFAAGALALALRRRAAPRVRDRV